tara:strand:+ start:428 stop:589 length:162 start_codon:yes stop_codon:yes gene_type:complete
MTSQLPEWKLRALQDPDLPEYHWQVLKLGPSSLAEAFILQAIKWKYQIRGMTH